MTQEEKKSIYTFVKNASSWILEYKDKDFNEEPVFEDDVIEYTKSTAQEENAPAQEEEAAQTEAAASANNSPITVDSLNEKIKNCKNCVLSKQRTNSVPGDGVLNPYVLVIGEGPGDAEDKSARAFTGPQGQLLDKMLNAINLDRKINCYITNIVKCRPPMNRTPMPDEAASCSGFLQAQIHILKPKVILCMGRTAFQNFLQINEGLSTTRGRWITHNGLPVMVTHSPGELLENTALKANAWNDLKMVKQYLNDTFPGYDEEYKNAKIH